jgi:RNA polymerase sigma-70 factor (ECF subfamily)
MVQDALTLQNPGEVAVRDSAAAARPLFDSLVERHSQLIYRIALAVTRNPRDAEDVVQEIFLRLYQAGRWEQIEDVQAYLARMAWRLAVRRKRPHCEVPIAEKEFLPQLTSEAVSPEASAIDAQLERWLHNCIDRLPEKLRQPLALAALGELKLVEIAKILGLPEGTVRRRVHTARKMLREQLEKRKGGTV